MPIFAAIDVGSNAIRLLIQEISNKGDLIREYFYRYALRLGGDVFKDQKIHLKNKNELINIFYDIKNHLKEKKVNTYRAIATEAMRQAKNKDEIVKNIYERFYIRLEIIDGQEESMLSRYVLLDYADKNTQNILFVDLGGGSLEIDYSTISKAYSLPFGSVRLLNYYREFSFAMSIKKVFEIGDDITKRLSQELKEDYKAELVLGLGGGLRCIQNLLPQTNKKKTCIDLNKLDGFIERIAVLENNEKLKLLKLRPDQADIILPASLTLRAICRVFYVQEFKVPNRGLREGIICKLAESFGISILKKN